MNNNFYLYKITSCDFIVHALKKKKKIAEIETRNSNGYVILSPYRVTWLMASFLHFWFHLNHCFTFLNNVSKKIQPTCLIYLLRLEWKWEFVI